jgi:hypothetical protein
LIFCAAMPIVASQPSRLQPFDAALHQECDSKIFSIAWRLPRSFCASSLGLMR